MSEDKISDRLMSLLSESRSVSLDKIKAAFPANMQWIVEIHLANMVDRGAVETKGKDADMTFTLKNAANEFQSKVSPEPEKTKEAATKYSLVTTLPESLLAMTPSMTQTREAMRMLFSETRREILVSQPFVDNTFVEVYEDEIRSLTKRGVKFKLLTRKVVVDNVNIRAMLKIFEIFSMHGQKESFELYEHWIPLSMGQDQSRQFVGLHAKLVIAEEAAYLGSANWTGFSLSNNVEIGMMIRDAQMVGQLRELYSLVLTQSAKIDIEKIHQALVHRDRDRYGR